MSLLPLIDRQPPQWANVLFGRRPRAMLAGSRRFDSDRRIKDLLEKSRWGILSR